MAKAITHADLTPSPHGVELGSKTGAFLMIFSILLSLSCFILCLIAEANRSEMTWVSTLDEKIHECKYTGSGKTTLITAGGAFVELAIAVSIQHGYLMAALSKSTSIDSASAWDPISTSAKSLTWQACFFFVSTWISFIVGEILLLIGISIESDHVKNWTGPRLRCLTVRPGLFATAGIFGLTTVFLAVGLYITALRALTFFKEDARIRRDILHAASLYLTPPRSPIPRSEITTMPNESPVIRNMYSTGRPLSEYLSFFGKPNTNIQV
ncbi:uncharacterized protein LOC124912878 [Impatiens glandulifera]|uniref:uncharacterized protein LOC124912878 n=1 Tax=Impatiens glandulifera TaxID=253017 RepID=UPI001FB07AF5|nr:uncharacterized protein LOC124912878 [Impatiens glandulifera]